MDRAIDWEQLAQQLGTLKADGESGGSEVAKQALGILIGEDQLRAAVDYYITGDRGSELARSVLWLLRPWSAMSRCYEIYKNADSVADRAAAVELLSVVADSRVIPWIFEFLANPEREIQGCGVGVLDQLLWGGGGDEEECVELLELARNHSNPEVREHAARIDEFLKRRKGRAEPLNDPGPQ